MEITFGVELEFLVSFPSNPEDSDVSESAASKRASVVPDSSTGFLPRTYVERKVRQALIANGFSVKPDPAEEGSEVKYDYTKWSVKDDTSIVPTGVMSRDWYSMEVVSPAFVARDASYDEIREVIKCIKDSFQVHINPTCGFHVHCGVGVSNSDYIPLWMLRRLGALFWAADLLLSDLHPPERILHYCLTSIRLQSRLSMGSEVAAARSVVEFRVGPEGNFITPFESDYEGAYQEMVKAQAFLHQLGADFANISSLILMSKLSLHDNQDPEMLGSGKYIEPSQSGQDTPESPRVSILPGALELLKCARPEEVAWLLACDEMPRPNYSFYGYDFASSWLGPRKKPTLEFRQAAGTLDAEWIISWSRICIGMMKYVRDSSLEELLTLLFKLDNNEKSPDTPYDVFAFLEDVGCSSVIPTVKERKERVHEKGWYDFDLYSKEKPSRVKMTIE